MLHYFIHIYSNTILNIWLHLPLINLLDVNKTEFCLFLWTKLMILSIWIANFEIDFQYGQWSLSKNKVSKSIISGELNLAFSGYFILMQNYPLIKLLS